MIAGTMMATVGFSSPQASPLLVERLRVWWNRTELEEGAKDYKHSQFDALGVNTPLSSSRGCSHHGSSSSLRFIGIGHV